METGKDRTPQFLAGSKQEAGFRGTARAEREWRMPSRTPRVSSQQTAVPRDRESRSACVNETVLAPAYQCSLNAASVRCELVRCELVGLHRWACRTAIPVL